MKKFITPSVTSAQELARTLGFPVKPLIKIAEHAGGSYEPFDFKRQGSTKWRHIDNPREV
ncbi:MAG: hypothetical protein Q7S79_03470 [bacterium]|nr:hypothetical protein [bacterium]